MPYDPVAFWNERARRHAADPLRAVCLDDPDENRCIDRIQRHVLRAALRRMERQTTLHGKSVLDYGCGTGRWISLLEQHGLVYHGTDIAGEMLALARHAHPGVDLRLFDGVRLSYPDRHFDVVWSVAVVHHNPHTVQAAILSELARVLAPGGSLILFEGVGVDAASDTNYFPRRLAEWLELAARHGLTCTWWRGATYLLLRPLATRTAGWVPPALQLWWRRLLTRIDAVVDPYLLPLLPPKFHTRAAMLFVKPCESRPS